MITTEVPLPKDSEITPKHCWVRTEDVVNGNLWRCFPAINCDKTKDVPIDYPGPIGVPITFFDIVMGGRNDGSSGWLWVDKLKGGRIEGSEKELYQRLIVRNLHPALPDKIDLVEWWERMGLHLDVVFLPPEQLPEDVMPVYRRVRTPKKETVL